MAKENVGLEFKLKKQMKKKKKLSSRRNKT